MSPIMMRLAIGLGSPSRGAPAGAGRGGGGAGGAGPVGGGGAGVVAVAGVSDHEAPAAREELTVAGVTGGQHAVEQIHPPRHALDQVLGGSDAHEVAGAVGGEDRREVLEDTVPSPPR